MGNDQRVIDEVLGVFGGSVRRMAQAADVAVQSAYVWVEKGYVPTRESALKLAAALLERGHPLTPARLMALEAAAPSAPGPGGKARKRYPSNSS